MLSANKLIVIAIVAMVLVTGASGMAGHYLAGKGPLPAEKSIVIQSGQSVRGMAAQLQREGVIANPLAFVAAVKLMGLSKTLQAGEYRFGAGDSLRTVINRMALGDSESRHVTVPEGYTVAQVLKVLGNEKALNGKPSHPAEGTVFPDTYKFRLGTSRAEIIDSMQQRMSRALAEAWAARDAATPYTTPDELLTMASIVQKEAANAAEMPMVAAVFVNRLKKGMKLQADPTVMYGAELLGNDIRKKDLTEPHPFNTYVYAGLPPTPISNPGKAALMAAAKPATAPYLFFVAGGPNGGHKFSTTYAEHNKNVKAYWQQRKQAENAASKAASAISPSTGGK